MIRVSFSLSALLLFFLLMSCSGGPQELEFPPESASESSGLSDSRDAGSAARIRGLLETFDAILSSSEKENDLTALWAAIRPRLNEGRIVIREDSQPRRSSLQGSRFTWDPGAERALILLQPDLLAELDENPVPALGELAGNLAFMADALEHGASLVELYADPLEYYLARMNGVYLHALFLSEYAVSLYGEESLGPNEIYLMQGLEYDAFSNYSLFVWGVDKDIVYSLLGLSTQLGRAEVDASYYVNQVLDLGTEIRDNFEESRRLFEESGEARGDDREIARRSLYISSTSAQTYRTLGSIIFATMIETLMTPEQQESLRSQLEDINALYQLFEIFVQESGDFRLAYRDEYLNGF